MWVLFLLVGFFVVPVVDLVVVADGSVPLRLAPAAAGFAPAAGPTAINIDSNPPRYRNAAPEGKYGELFALIFSL
jgi:hypothetical protein